MQRILTSTTALLLSVPMTGWAQQAIDAGDIKLEDWDYSSVYSGDSWSVEDLFDQPAMGQNNDEIGEVEDLVFDTDGRLVAVIAEVGGFWDMGDTHVSVPWSEVNYAGESGVTLPVTEDNVDMFDVFDSSGLPGTKLGENVVPGVDDEELPRNVWRASDLIGDYARIRGEDESWINFGYVTDIVVRDDEVIATVVQTHVSVAGDTYAYPPSIRGGVGNAMLGRDIGRPTYDMPILLGEAIDLPAFERERVGSM